MYSLGLLKMIIFFFLLTILFTYTIYIFIGITKVNIFIVLLLNKLFKGLLKIGFFRFFISNLVITFTKLSCYIRSIVFILNFNLWLSKLMVFLLYLYKVMINLRIWRTNCHWLKCLFVVNGFLKYIIW